MMFKPMALLAVITSVFLIDFGPGDVDAPIAVDAPVVTVLSVESVPYDPANAGDNCGGCHTECFGDEHAVWTGFEGGRATHECFGPEYCPNHPACEPDDAQDVDQLIATWEGNDASRLESLRAMVVAHEFAWVNEERSSIQLERCGGLAANLPLSPAELQTLTD